MLILDATTKRVRVALNAAQTSAPMRVVSSWRDTTATAFTPGATLVSTAGSTPVDVVPAPAASTQRVCDFISVMNTDTGSKVVTLSVFDGTTDFVLAAVALGVNERLEYRDTGGIAVFNSAGALKTITTGVANPVTSGETIGVLTADVINNNATANTIADVTGLSFPVVTGSRYWFKFFLNVTTAATTTGARFSVSGPTTTALSYSSRYPLTTTTETVNRGLTAYDQPAAANASLASTVGNIVFVEGMVVPSADGNVIARFASEITASAVTVKAGSYVSSRVV